MVKLTVRHRNNMHGVPCVAPFIDDHNVWDIPEKEWTEAVRKAVSHAYVLGVRAAVRDTYTQLGILRNNLPDLDQLWEKDNETR